MKLRPQDWMKKLDSAGITLISLALLLCLTAQGNEAFAERFRFQWGTGITASGQYDDNIKLSPDEFKDHDWIMRITPYVRLSLLRQETEASLQYGLSFVHYFIEESNRLRHNLSLTGFKGIPIAERFTLDLDNRFYISEDPIEPSEDVVSVRSDRSRYYRNTFEGRVNYLFGPEDTLYAGFGHMWLHNESTNVQNSQRFWPMAGFDFSFGIRYGFRAEYRYTRGFQEISSDYSDHRAMASFTYLFGPRTTGNLSYDYSYFEYDEPNLRNYGVHQITAGLNRQFSPRLVGSISGGFFLMDWQLEELNSEIPGDFMGSFSLSWALERGSFNVSGSSGYRRQFGQAENLGLSFYGRVSASLGYQLLERLSGHITGGYFRDEYQETIPRREDQTWYATASLSYPLLRWLSSSLRYQYRQRDSSIDTGDYVVNRVTISVTASHLGQPKPL